MGKHIVVISLLLIVSIFFSQTHAQILFKELVFEKVTITKNVAYRDESTAKKKYSQMDVYEAKDDSNRARPLIIWLHGGGFKYGNKTSNGTPIWSKTFAQRGYVCAAANYRLSKKKPLRRFPDLVEGCMDAVEDTRAIISFFKTNYSLYRIDTNRIILAGNSAGAMISLQSVYSSPYEMAKLIGKTETDSLRKSYNPDGIAGIISFWGAVYDSNWIRNEKVPIAIVYGSRDKIVPPTNKGPLSGGKVIYRNAQANGIPSAMLSFEGYGHELQKSFNPFWAGKKTKKRWLEAGQFAATFLYENLLR